MPHLWLLDAGVTVDNATYLIALCEVSRNPLVMGSRTIAPFVSVPCMARIFFGIALISAALQTAWALFAEEKTVVLPLALVALVMGIRLVVGGVAGFRARRALHRQGSIGNDVATSRQRMNLAQDCSDR